MKGRFITLEGGEGVGKSTQARRLAEALGARGIDVVLTREPGGSSGAEAIRTLLLTGETDRWSAQGEALLFAAARSDHVIRTILPALEADRFVLCDRFLDSSIVYQGIVGGVGEEAVRNLHAIGSFGLLPARTLLLTLSPQEAERRAMARDNDAPDRIGAKGSDYHTRIYASFDRLSEREPDRFRRIDAQGEVKAVTDRLLAALDDLL